MKGFLTYNMACLMQLPWMAILATGFVLWMAVCPVETRWAKSDVTLAWGIVILVSLAVIIQLSACLKREYRKGIVRWNLLDALAMLWFLYYLMRSWMDGEFACATAFLKTVEMALMYFALRGIFATGKLPQEGIMCGLLACGVYESAIGVGQILNGTSRHYLYMVTGSFQNPGPYSALLAMGSAIGLAWMKKKEPGWSRYGIALATVLMLLILPATWSRAAFVALVTVVLWIFKADYWKWRWMVWLGCILACIALYYIKQGSADGRMMIWTAAITTWLHCPWTGVGIGGFENACANGVAELYGQNPHNALFINGDVAEFAFNDLLKVLVEQGAAGALLCIGTMGYTLHLLRKESGPLFCGMLSLLIFSLFSYPFELIPYRIISVVVAAWAASEHGRRKGSKSSWKSGMIPLLLLAPACLTAKEVGKRYSADREYLTFAGMEYESFIKDYYALLPMKRDDARFLFDFGKTLRAHGRYNDSNGMLWLGTRVSADPMFYVVMGNNYCDMGHTDLAEEAYRKAFAVMPNRIYPLYLLMKMHRKEGNEGKAWEYAERVKDFREKVVSPATRQMKQEAEELLKKTEGDRQEMHFMEDER